MVTSYVPNLTKASLLSPSDESRLIRLAQSGDINARNRVIEANMRLVIALTKSYLTSGMEFEDLIQEGVFGLIKALERFDPSLGYRFSTYATHWVKHDLGRVIDNRSRPIRLPAYVNDLLRKVVKAQGELKDATGLDPDEDTLAAYLGMTPHVLHKLMSEIPTTISLEEPVGPDTPLGALLEDEGAGDPLRLALDASDRSTVTDALRLLNPIERQILLLKLDDASYDSLHETIGISRDRIKSLETTAIRKLADAARTRCLIT